jgi:hypothetical protein
MLQESLCFSCRTHTTVLKGKVFFDGGNTIRVSVFQPGFDLSFRRFSPVRVRLDIITSCSTCIVFRAIFQIVSSSQILYCRHSATLFVLVASCCQGCCQKAIQSCSGTTGPVLLRSLLLTRFQQPSIIKPSEYLNKQIHHYIAHVLPLNSHM